MLAVCYNIDLLIKQQVKRRKSKMEELYRTFTLQIAKCNRYIRKLKQVKMETFGLKGPHVSCLYYLYKSDTPLTLKELCDICDEDKAYVSRAVDALKKDGYITSNSKAEKRYRDPLLLTEKGVETAKGIERKIDEIVRAAGEGVTPEEREIFYKTLAHIGNNLQKMSEEGLQ